MDTRLDLDSSPWYRQFWLWFIILLPASVVVAGIITVYIAAEGADDLVADDYYKNGLAINQQLEKKQLATSLGISANLELGKHSVAVRVTGPVTENTLYLLLSHPLEADRDFVLEVERVEPGFYAGILEQPIFSRWYWVLENRGQQAWRIDGSVTLPPSDNADHN
ncbi:MAG: FixH family protein [Halioglobus sp.]